MAHAGTRRQRAALIWVFAAALCSSSACRSGHDDPKAAPPVDECANVGCALPPVCGTACSSKCGCCGCTPGQTFSGGTLVCTAQQCLAPSNERADVIDCSNVGCAAPPMCGTGCAKPCGCCPCAEGQVSGTLVCRNGCYELVDGATDAASDALIDVVSDAVGDESRDAASDGG